MKKSAIIISIILILILGFIGWGFTSRDNLQEYLFSQPEYINDEYIHPYRYILLTPDEYELLVCAVMAEAGSNSEPHENRMAVCQVILNRLISGKWGNSIESVLSAKNQFSCWPYLKNVIPTEDCYKAVEEVLMGENLPVSIKTIYFGQYNHSNFTVEAKIGGHVFGY